MLFTLKKVLGGMMLPLPLLLLLIAFGIALLWFSRFQRTGKLCVSLGWLLLLLLSLQPVADSLLKPIEDKYPTWRGENACSTWSCLAEATPGTRTGRPVPISSIIACRG